MDDHFTYLEERGRRERREKREETELINHRGESSMTNFPNFNILPQADPEALDVIILAGVPGLEQMKYVNKLFN